MPAPGQPPLRDYQTKGILWLLSQLQDHRAVLLADDAGLGKTLQALEAAKSLNAERILIICPAGARRVWANEIHRWVPEWDDRVVLVEPGIASLIVATGLVLKPAIVIVSYDEMSNLKSGIARQLHLVQWDLMILDEAHYLKNPSNRTQTIYGRHGGGLQAAAKKVVLLTGTPTPNHAGELWQHYRTFWPKALGTEKPFTQAQFEERFTRYRDTVYGRQVTGSKNQKALRELLGPVILRRRKSEVLIELPPLILQDIPLTPSPDWPPKDDTIRGTAYDINELMGLAQDHDEALRYLLRAMTTATSALATVRRALGEAKIQPAIRWIEERLQSTDKMLVFAWHRSVLNELYKGLLEFDPVVISGETQPADRVARIEKFQTQPGCRLFIGQILAAGTAITLTAASEVAIVEPSWVPGENVQAIARAHRLGQRDSVLASFLFLPGTLDQRIMATFRRKAAEISELQGDPKHAASHAHV